MSVKIRLKRMGARNAPSFRVVVADARSPRDGKFLENLGWYDPQGGTGHVKLDLERYAHWISQGAQASDTVRSLARKAKRAAREEPVRAEAPATEPAVETVADAEAVAEGETDTADAAAGATKPEA